MVYNLNEKWALAVRGRELRLTDRLQGRRACLAYMRYGWDKPMEHRDQFANRHRDRINGRKTQDRRVRR